MFTLFLKLILSMRHPMKIDIYPIPYANKDIYALPHFTMIVLCSRQLVSCYTPIG